MRIAQLTALFSLCNGQLSYYVTTFAGTLFPGHSDGPLSAALFSSPNSVANGPNGIMYVVDSGSHTIRKIENGKVTTLAGIADTPGLIDGPLAKALFNKPLDVVYDSQKGLLVADGTLFPNKAVITASEESTWKLASYLPLPVL
jgi:hypothetical protein